MIKRNISTKWISIIIAILSIIIGVIFNELENSSKSNRIHSHKDYKHLSNIEYNKINSDNIDIEKFSTNMPIVVIDTKGEKIKNHIKWSIEEERYVEEDIDPYTIGDISIIYEEGKENTLSDKENVKSNMKIKMRGNTSSGFDKKQYLIKLLDEEGKEKKREILGMGKESEWILNISGADQSLIRNYMALNIAGEIMEYSPNIRFCEVFFKEDNDYIYNGVYLIMESIKRSEERVNISKYDSKFEESSFLLRRDRFDEKAVILNNYGRENKLTTGYLEVKYPNKNDITDRTKNYIEEYINNLEKSLFSNDKKEFKKYKEYIDEKSFIDYFIINEFFANYDSGYHSTYMYKEVNEKIKMGPVWDFDMAIDNNKITKLKIDSTAMHDAPWFRQLLRDSSFVEKLINRYKELRKGILSEKNINNYIDETVKYIGNAQKRDRDKWGDFYEKLNKKYDLNEKYLTYKEEIDKVKFTLSEHGKWLDENLDSLYQFSEFDTNEQEEGLKSVLLGRDDSVKIGNIVAIVFIIGFILSIIIVQRE